MMMLPGLRQPPKQPYCEKLMPESDIRVDLLTTTSLADYVYVLRDGTFQTQTVADFVAQSASLDIVGRGFDTVAGLLADTFLTYIAGASGYVSVGKNIAAGGHRFAVVEDAPTGYHLETAGGVKLVVLEGANGYDLTAFGVVPSIADDQSAIAQAAIDALLELDAAGAYLPTGEYNLPGLRLYNEAGGDRAQRGKFRLRGAGNMGLDFAYRGTTDIGDIYGTVVDVTGADPADPGLSMADSTDTDNRRGRLEGLTLVYGGTGYAIEADYCPFSEIEDVTVRCTSAGGGALSVKNSWGLVCKRFIAAADINLESAAVGVRYEPTLFAGNIVFDSCIVDHFQDCFELGGSANFANITFENTWPQKFLRYGVHVTAPLWGLFFNECYMESAGDIDDNPGEYSEAYVKIDPSSPLRNLSVNGLFCTSGTQTEAWSDGAAVFDLENVQQAAIRDATYFRPWIPLVHIRSQDTMVELDGVSILHDNGGALPGPVSMVTGEPGVEGKVTINRGHINNETVFSWVDATIGAFGRHDHVTAPLALALGAPLPVTITHAAPFSWGAAQPKPISVLVTSNGGGDGAVQLPALSGLASGDVRYVYVDAASTHGAILRNHSNSSIGLTVTAGQVARCVADPANDQWLVTAQDFVAGP